MASINFDIDTLIKVQSFNFNQNISANFKAWICTIHPEYIRTSLTTKIAPHDLTKLKEKYNYEKLRKDPNAPWHMFVKKLPQLIQNAQQTTPQAQQSDLIPKTLQQQYDTLLIEHYTLKTQYEYLTSLTKCFHAPSNTSLH